MIDIREGCRKKFQSLSGIRPRAGYPDSAFRKPNYVHMHGQTFEKKKKNYCEIEVKPCTVPLKLFLDCSGKRLSFSVAAVHRKGIYQEHISPSKPLA